MNITVAVLGLISAATFATSASATVYVSGDPGFTVAPLPGKTLANSPVINGILGIFPTNAGTFTDDFEFTIPQDGFGSGSVITTANLTTSSNYIDFIAVSFNSKPIPIAVTPFPFGGILQAAGMTGVPIVTGVLNTLEVTYTTLGAGSYAGQLTFDAAPLPEPATWAVFLLAFGVIGFALRRQDRAPAIIT